MTVPDCKPHITLHYLIWRLTCACKYELSFPRTYHAPYVACQLSLWNRNWRRAFIPLSPLAHHHVLTLYKACYRTYFSTAHIAAPIIRRKINSAATEECENRESCILHYSQRNVGQLLCKSNQAMSLYMLKLKNISLIFLLNKIWQYLLSQKFKW